jgi:hypothetical protein
LLALSAVAVALLLILWHSLGNPAGPVALSPGATLLRGHIPSSPVTLSWIEPGMMATLSGNGTGRATRFIVCFYDTGAAAHDCRAGTGTLLREDHGAATIAHQDAPLLGNWMDWLEQKVNPRYRYTLQVSLPQSALDLSLGWTVGACKPADDSTCTFATDQILKLTARDLHINRIDYTSYSDRVEFQDDIVNEGETASEPFRLETAIWEVIMIAQPPSAQTDINAPGVAESDIVVTKDGEEHPVREYRNGSRPLAELLAIHKPGMASIRWTRLAPDVPTPGQPLALPVDPCDYPPCKIVTTRRPTMLAGWARVGDRTAHWEFDDSDNETYRSSMRAN